MMRRAMIATTGTVVGVIALLGYKSSGAVGTSHVAVGVPSSSASTTLPPTSTAPGSAGPPTNGSTPATSTAPSTTPSTTPPTTVVAGPRAFTGQDVPYQYGDIQVRITLRSGKISDIAIPQESSTDPRSQSINSQAVPILTQEALAAQNLQFNVVSGATFTSNAFAQALQSALTKAGR